MQNFEDDDGRWHLDPIDLKLLSVLQENGRISNVELAHRVHLTPSPCLSRVKALEREGFISKYVALLDPKAMGLGVEAFIQVRLEKQVQSSFSIFEKSISARPEVMQCFLMTGGADYLVRVLVPDLEAFQELLTDFLAKIPGVANTQSSISLREVKFSTAVPVFQTKAVSN